MRNLKLLIGLVALTLFSCGDKEVEIPSYIYVDHIDLETKSDEGSNLHKITDVWVTIGPDFIGAFELPCKIPILKEGEFELSIRAGVILNGISATRTAFSPFEICTVVDLDDNEINTITLTRDSVTYFNAKTTYREGVVKDTEGFEGAGWILKSEKLTTVEDTDTIVYSAELQKTSVVEEVKDGAYSGVVHLTKENHTVFLRTEKEFDIPPTGSGVGKFNYLELDYKTDVDLVVGLWFNFQNTTIDWGGLRSNDDWRKVYLHISPEQANNTLSSVAGATRYSPYIRASLPEGMDEAYIYIDNFKLIHENE